MQWFRKLARDTRGNILMIAGSGTMAMVGAAGIGVDTVQWYLWKRQMQQAVDSAAMAGVLNIHQGFDWESAAEGEMERTANTTYTIEQLTNPPTTGAYKGSNLAVEIVAITQTELPFSSMFLPAAPTVRVRSVAASIQEGTNCVISLAPTGIGIDVAGDADIDLGCGIVSNSGFSTAVDITGSAKMKANPISAHGGINANSGTIPAGTTILPYSQKVKDPLAERGLTAPTTPAGCTGGNNFTIKPKEVVELDPGRYCNGLTIRGDAILKPGVYIIDGGSLKVNSQATITGDGVTFVLTGNGSTVADVDISAGAKVTLSAPTSDEDAEWYDILFFQEDGFSTESVINGGSDMAVDGIFYFPSGDIRFNGNAGQSADCLLLIANRVKMSGATAIKNNCPVEFDSYDLAARIIRVVE